MLPFDWSTGSTAVGHLKHQSLFLVLLLKRERERGREIEGERGREREREGKREGEGKREKERHRGVRHGGPNAELLTFFIFSDSLWLDRSAICCSSMSRYRASRIIKCRSWSSSHWEITFFNSFSARGNSFSSCLRSFSCFCNCPPLLLNLLGSFACLCRKCVFVCVCACVCVCVSAKVSHLTPHV